MNAIHLIRNLRNASGVLRFYNMSEGNSSPSGIESNSTKASSSTKRNSGLFSFFRWFKSSTSKESVNSDINGQNSCSSESINSIQSAGTVASFSYVPPSAYKPETIEPKIINQGPETDTYKARLKQRDKRREKDKNTTLRKKYNLFFNRDTLFKDNCKSLPLMTRTNVTDEQQHPCHRRTASESSKLKRAGAYCHVKGKRKAPQPPSTTNIDNQSTSMRRKKRLAPQPPAGSELTHEKVLNAIQQQTDVIYNDSLKLEQGILKSAKDADKNNTSQARSSCCYVEAPVSPRPWYKRNTNANVVTNKENKEQEENNKRKSTVPLLTNISELDREASRIVKEQHQQQKSNDYQPPLFMRPKDEQLNMDTLQQPSKRRSARDLIAKFNAITNVTKVTVNTALFNGKKDYFGRQKESNPLMKSESATSVVDRKNWNCPKCNADNEYWRIICHSCSTIKPYFDDLNAPKKTSSVAEDAKPSPAPAPSRIERNFERSKTQIGFTVTNKEDNAKKEEREKLKKMLIEMKNSLPKKKHVQKQIQRKSVIEENPETSTATLNHSPERSAFVVVPQKPSTSSEKEEIDKEDKREIIVSTKETIYENIKVKENVTKPIKVSSSAQTSGVIKKIAYNEIDSQKNYELLRPKDFAEMQKNKKIDRIYANLAEKDELSLFFNAPKKFDEINSKKSIAINTDTIEINRLLKRLENAIVKGEMTDAAVCAQELAQLKVNCSVVRQKERQENVNAGFT